MLFSFIICSAGKKAANKCNQSVGNQFLPSLGESVKLREVKEKGCRGCWKNREEGQCKEGGQQKERTAVDATRKEEY